MMNTNLSFDGKQLTVISHIPLSTKTFIINKYRFKGNLKECLIKLLLKFKSVFFGNDSLVKIKTKLNNMSIDDMLSIVKTKQSFVSLYYA